MTDREKEILDLIKEDPLISQNDLADKLNITRSSISVHISNLMKKGYIKGKGYVMADEGHNVVVIGGSNIDITGTIDGHLNKHDSNPGSVKMALGGVARNIAENLAHLGANVQLISAVGDDFYGDKILQDCKHMKIDMSLCKKYGDYRTSVYMQVLDGNGHLDIAIADMEIMNKITVEQLNQHHKTLEQAKAIVADGNLSESVLDYLTSQFGHKLFFDTVSIAKSIKIKPFLDKVYCLTPNLMEAQEIVNENCSIEEAVTLLKDRGVRFPLITNGSKGLVYYDKEVKTLPSIDVDVKSVTGAGDALIAGIVYGFVHDQSKETCLFYGLTMASETLKTFDSVSRDIKNLNLIKE